MDAKWTFKGMFTGLSADIQVPWMSLLQVAGVAGDFNNPEARTYNVTSRTFVSLSKVGERWARSEWTTSQHSNSNSSTTALHNGSKIKNFFNIQEHYSSTKKHYTKNVLNYWEEVCCERVRFFMGSGQYRACVESFLKEMKMQTLAPFTLQSR